MNVRLANRFRSTVTQSKRVRKTKSVLVDLHATSPCGGQSRCTVLSLGNPFGWRWMEEVSRCRLQLGLANCISQRARNTTTNHYGYMVATSRFPIFFAPHVPQVTLPSHIPRKP